MRTVGKLRTSIIRHACTPPNPPPTSPPKEWWEKLTRTRRGENWRSVKKSEDKGGNRKMTARNLKMFSRSGSHYGGVVVRELVPVKMKPDICKKLEDNGLEDKPWVVLTLDNSASFAWLGEAEPGTCSSQTLISTLIILTDGGKRNKETKRKKRERERNDLFTGYIR